MFKEDWDDVAKIYKHGMDTKMATFETQVPKWKYWKKTHVENCSLVAQSGDTIVGFASISPVSHREVYKGVGEVSIYVDKDARGRGVGRILLDSLIRATEDKGFWSLQAGIFSVNETSIELHKKCGFRIVGVREKIGKLDGKWQDNTLMERRSDKF
ncbi:phosphinothricin acetyltransferase [Flavobacteriaceae bacterium MAR_2010_188]|nr:phosphinothricin acetyltransferase [Flavobacteriaceae bacterium MAR_2010_188]